MEGRKLIGIEEVTAILCMYMAQEAAKEATCLIRKCGAVVVADVDYNMVIGEGANSPPGNMEHQRRCHLPKSSFHPKVTDKTCCVHAEVRAIMEAMQNYPGLVKNSRLYFVAVDDEGRQEPSGPPYCTICSKIVLDVGIAEIVLRHEDGIYAYEAALYYNLSFGYEEE